MDIRYGRGKFQPPEAYVEYMNMIVDSERYAGMPCARAENGKINWQCSSGKTTSFYRYFPDRSRWWAEKADELGIPGTGNSDDRFTIAARMIHPTGKKVCLICGQPRYIGYMYMNANCAKRWNGIVGERSFHKTMPIDKALEILISAVGIERARDIVLEDFPEKAEDIELFDAGEFEAFFSATQHIRTSKLSPGFMGDCPHRLDGIHDYCTFCRKRSDPGRSDENMRTYEHDRRAFMWWAEGDWKAADTLYNSAGPGICVNCGKHTRKISPDHVGPLACGFKQNAFFKPLCGKCNSAKNRRFTFSDVRALLDYERRRGETAASWQVDALWRSAKGYVEDDASAKLLSDHMRAMQHYFLRALFVIADLGYYDFLTSYLHPEYSYFAVTYDRLDTSTLSHNGYEKREMYTNGTRSSAARSVRIAFEELFEYCSKPAERRKSILFKTVDRSLEEDAPAIRELFSRRELTDTDERLRKILDPPERSSEEKDAAIQEIIETAAFACRRDRYRALMERFEGIVDRRGYQLARMFVREIEAE